MPSSRRALFATAESSLSGLDLLSPAVLTSRGRPRKERVPKFSSRDIPASLSGCHPAETRNMSAGTARACSLYRLLEGHGRRTSMMRISSIYRSNGIALISRKLAENDDCASNEVNEFDNVIARLRSSLPRLYRFHDMRPAAYPDDPDDTYGERKKLAARGFSLPFPSLGFRGTRLLPLLRACAQAALSRYVVPAIRTRASGRSRRAD